MERGIITINEMGMVTMPPIPVWMTLFEIADLFGIFPSDIRKIIRSIYKSHELDEQTTMRYLKISNRVSMDVYSLEMIVGIAFRLRSRESLFFRKYVLRQLLRESKSINYLMFKMKEKENDPFKFC